MDLDIEDEDEPSASFAVALSDDNFDAQVFLRERFPDEVSLRNGLDALVEEGEAYSKSMRESVVRSVRRQAVYGDQSMRDLKDAKGNVLELFDRLEEIQEKARETQSMVKTICADIQSLDAQKQRLNVEKDALQRLSVLVYCVEEGTRLAREKSYQQLAPIANAMCRVNLDDVAAIEPQVQALVDKKTQLLHDLTAQLMEEYDAVFDPGEEPTLAETKAAYCVDALPPYVRREILTRCTLKYLEEYKRLFHPQQEAAQLEVAERRFAWLSRKLREFDERYAKHFPDEWMLPCQLCELFCHITRQHLVEVLGSCHTTCDPEALVKLLRKSIHFENDMAARFEGSRLSKLPVDLSVLTYPEVLAPLPAEPESVAPRFRGIVSECFECYLGSWVRHEEQKLVDLLETETLNDEYMADEEDSEAMFVFSSVQELFVAMENMLKKCAQFSKHQTLFEVFLAFQRILDRYRTILERRLPTWLQGALTDEIAQNISAVVGTTEYVDATLLRMQDVFQSTIDPAFTVSFDSNLDTFGALTTKAFLAFVHACETALEPCMAKMSRTAWELLNKNDESPYIRDISSVLTSNFSKVFKYLSHLHYRFFCDKFAEMFIPKFVAEARKTKAATPGAASRLRTDVAILKTVLLEVPVVVAGGKSTSTAYSSFVVREMDKAVQLLEGYSVSAPTPDTIQDYAQDTIQRFTAGLTLPVSVPRVSSTVSDVKRKLLGLTRADDF